MAILIVDDIQTNRYLLESLFNGKGYRTFSAGNGREAMDLLAKNKVDLLITDILMPEMDGYQLCKEVKGNPAYASIPVVFYTATFTTSQDEELAMQLGASTFIRKPANPAEFMRIVESILNQKENGGLDTSGIKLKSETDIFKLYNQRLVKKLEDKIMALEKETVIRHSVEQESKMLAQALKGISECITVTDLENNLVFVNDALLTTYGYQREELLGKDVAILRAGLVDRINYDEIMIQTVNGGWKGELSQKKKNGEVFLISLSTSCVRDDEGRVIALIGVATDITKQRDLENKYRQAQKMEAVGTLAGGLAHDFNNILSGIMGPISLMRNRIDRGVKIDETQLVEFLDIMNQSSLRASELVRQLLTLSRKQKTTKTVFDLNDAIRHIIKVLNSSIDKSIEIIDECKKDYAPVYCNPTQIEQVLLNLCINASHAMTIMRLKKDIWGGKLTLCVDPVVLSEEQAQEHSDLKPGNYWLLKVADTGVGIDKDVILQIFNPFFTTKDKEVGTGLGLSMVYNIIKDHNGCIEVSSKLGEGTIFQIYLPVYDGVESRDEGRADNTIKTQTGTVLFVDDDTYTCKVAKLMLQDAGYQVIVAEDGAEGIAAFSKLWQEIDLVILDIAMHGLSGKEIFVEMKKINPDVKVLLSSGLKDDDRIQEIMDMGVSQYLPKPYDFNQLIDAVSQTQGNKLK